MIGPGEKGGTMQLKGNEAVRKWDERAIGVRGWNPKGRVPQQGGKEAAMAAKKR